MQNAAVRESLARVLDAVAVAVQGVAPVAAGGQDDHDEPTDLLGDEEWQRKTRRSGSLAEFFASSPLHDSGLQIDRIDAAPRDTAL